MTTNGGGASRVTTARSAAPPVREDAKPEQAARFADRLGQAEKQLKETRDGKDARNLRDAAKKGGAPAVAANPLPTTAAPPRLPIGPDGKPLLSRKGMFDDERHDEVAQPLAAAALRAQAATAPAPATPAAQPDDTRVLDRMAAAIAECCATKRDPQFTLQFAPGSIADGVLLGRAANGAIAVQIVGLDARLSPTQAERLRSGLSDALVKRRLRLDGVTLEDSGDRQVDAPRST